MYVFKNVHSVCRSLPHQTNHAKCQPETETLERNRHLGTIITKYWTKKKKINY